MPLLHIMSVVSVDTNLTQGIITLARNILKNIEAILECPLKPEVAEAQFENESQVGWFKDSANLRAQSSIQTLSIIVSSRFISFA